MRANRALIYLLLVAGSVIFLLPLLWMISTSLKPADQTVSLPPQWGVHRPDYHG